MQRARVVSHHIVKLRPIFIELDKNVPLNKPVPVEDLIPLFEAESGKKIELIPVPSELVGGIHLGTKDGTKAYAIHKRCEAHYKTDVIMACPGCQEARFDIAKELVHTLDLVKDKTPPDKAAGELIHHLMKQAWGESPQVFADGWGQWWGLELLIRFRHRVLMHGGSMVLAMAKATNDYSQLAAQYCVPQDIVRRAYGDTYMDLMKGIREKHGLSCAAGPIDGPQI